MRPRAGAIAFRSPRATSHWGQNRFRSTFAQQFLEAIPRTRTTIGRMALFLAAMNATAEDSSAWKWANMLYIDAASFTALMLPTASSLIM